MHVPFFLAVSNPDGTSVLGRIEIPEPPRHSIGADAGHSNRILAAPTEVSERMVVHDLLLLVYLAIPKDVVPLVNWRRGCGCTCPCDCRRIRGCVTIHGGTCPIERQHGHADRETGTKSNVTPEQHCCSTKENIADRMHLQGLILPH